MGEKRGFLLLMVLGIILFSESLIVSSLEIHSVYANFTSESNSTSTNLTGYVNYSNPSSENFTFIYNWYRGGFLNRTTLLEDSLISYYPFDYDYSDYYFDNDLNFSNVVNFTEGVKGDSLFFNGEILSNNTSSVIGSVDNNISISFWLKTNSNQTYQDLISVWNNNLGRGYSLRLIEGDWIRFTSNSQPNNITDFRQGSTFAHNQWHHILITYDFDNYEYHLYIDGLEKSYYTTNTPYSATSDTFKIGNTILTNLNNTNIDELMFFDKILSPLDANKLYLGGLELNRVSSQYTFEGDLWTFGAKTATKDLISSQLNSSSLNVNSVLHFSEDTPTNFFNISLPIYLDSSEISNSHYSVLDIDDSLRWWISFEGVGVSNLGYYNSYNQVSGSGGSIIPGVYGNAFSVPTSTYYYVQNWAYILPDSFWTDQEFTVSAWAKLNNKSNVILKTQQDSASRSIIDLGNCSGSFGAWSNRGAGCFGVNLDDYVVLDEWTMFSLVYDHGTLSAYVNGSFVGAYYGIPDYENNTSYKGAKDGTQARMWIGQNSNHLGSHVTALDELIFIQRALNSQEISSLYNSSGNNINITYYDPMLASGDNLTLRGHSSDGNTFYSTLDTRNLQMGESFSINIDSKFRDNLVFQRNLSTNTTTFELKGNYTPSYNGQIAYSINGIEYDDLSYSLGVFSKNLTLPIGSYDIKVYSVIYPNIYDEVTGVGVGDVILITGQSNARLTYSNLNSYYSPQANYTGSFTSVNGYDGMNWTYYSSFNQYSINNQWFPLIDQISKTQNVPVMMISAVIGGSGVSCWANMTSTGVGETRCYLGLLDQLNNLTNNNSIYGVIYYQGEQDGSTENYKGFLNNYLNNLFSDVNIYSNKIIIGNTWSDGNIPYYPQKAIQEVWQENSSIVKIGAYVYDMNTTALGGTVHFSEISNEGWPFINRWKTAGLYGFYGQEDMKVPQLVGVYKYNSTRVDMVYDRNLLLSDFLNNPGSIAWGIQLYDGSDSNFTRPSDWNMSDVNLTTVQGKVVSYYFNENISSATDFSFCINTYCHNKTIVRDATSNYPSAFPPLMVYPTMLNATDPELLCLGNGNYWYSNSCHDSPYVAPTTPPSSSSGGSSGGGSSISNTQIINNSVVNNTVLQNESGQENDSFEAKASLNDTFDKDRNVDMVSDKTGIFKSISNLFKETFGTSSKNNSIEGQSYSSQVGKKSFGILVGIILFCLIGVSIYFIVFYFKEKQMQKYEGVIKKDNFLNKVSSLSINAGDKGFSK